MRVGCIADIHANRPALQAVLDDMPPVDRLVCAGDVVGYYPWPVECVDTVRERDIPTVSGNHDRAVASGTAFRFNRMAAAGVEFARDRLDDDRLAWLDSLPDETRALDGRVKIVHGHPDDPDRYTYPSEFTREMLDDETALVLGHTHIQGHRTFDGRIVCNPGSVGQPRDGDPRAAYAVLDLDSGSVEEHRVPYDIDRVVERVEGVGLPAAVGSRLYDGR